MKTNYWLTVHYPPLSGEEEAEWDYWVFLKTRRENLGVGDHVFIYETGANPSVKRDGDIIARPPGRKAVVALVRVTSRVRRHGGGPEVLADGRVHNWRFVAEARPEKPCDIPIVELRKALRKPGWCARVPGGLAELTEAQFKRILAECR